MQLDDYIANRALGLYSQGRGQVVHIVRRTGAAFTAICGRYPYGQLGWSPERTRAEFNAAPCQQCVVRFAKRGVA